MRTYLAFLGVLLLAACSPPPPSAGGGLLKPPNPAFTLHPLMKIDRPFPVRQGGWTEIWVTPIFAASTPQSDIDRFYALAGKAIPVKLVDPPAWITESRFTEVVDPYNYRGVPLELVAPALAVRISVAPDAPLGEHTLTLEVGTPTPRRGTVRVKVLPGVDPRWTCGEPGPGLPNDPGYWRSVKVPPIPGQDNWRLNNMDPDRVAPVGPNRPILWAMGLEEAWLRMPIGCDPIYVLAADMGSPDFRLFWGHDVRDDLPGTQRLLMRVRKDILGHLALDPDAPPPENPTVGVSKEALAWWVADGGHMADPEEIPAYPEGKTFVSGPAQGQAPCFGTSDVPSWYMTADACHGNDVIQDMGGGTWNDAYATAGLWMNQVKFLPLSATTRSGGNAAIRSPGAWDFAQHGRYTYTDGTTVSWPHRTSVIATATALGLDDECALEQQAYQRGLLMTAPVGNKDQGSIYTEQPAGCPQVFGIGAAIFKFDPDRDAMGWARGPRSAYGDASITPNIREHVDFVMPGEIYAPYAWLPPIYGIAWNPATSPASMRFGGLIGFYLYTNEVFHGDPYRGLWGKPELVDRVFACFKAAASNGGQLDEETGWGVVDIAKIADPDFAPCHW